MIIRELVNKISFKVDQSGFRKAESLIASYKNKMKGLVQDQRNMLKSEAVATRAVISNLATVNKTASVARTTTTSTTKAIQSQTKAVKSNSVEWERSIRRRANELRKIPKAHQTKRESDTLALSDRYSSRTDNGLYRARERVAEYRRGIQEDRRVEREKNKQKANVREAAYNVRNSAAMGMAAAGLPLAYGAKKGLDYSLSVEKEKMVMGGIMGDKNKGAALAQTLIDYSNKTVLETEPTLRAAKTLMMSGIPSKDVLGIVGALGNATAGDSEKMYGVARQLGQIKINNKLMGQDLNTITANDVALKPALIKTMGISGPVFASMMRKGQISYEMVEKALKTINPGMLDIMGDTNWGKIQMMKDALTTSAGAMTDVWMPEVKKFAETITSMANAMKEWSPNTRKVVGGVTGLSIALVGIGVPLAFAINQIIQLGKSLWILATSATAANASIGGSPTTTTAPTFDKEGKAKGSKGGKSQKVETPKIPTPRRGRFGGGKLSRIASTGGGMGAGGLLSRAFGPFLALAQNFGDATLDGSSGASVDRMKEIRSAGLSMSSSKNIETTININDLRVPEGTTAQQKQSFVDSAKRIFNQEFQSFMAGAVSNTGGI